jgi:NADH:ubiquinone oxidoreductase subunit F (NADH-binding)
VASGPAARARRRRLPDRVKWNFAAAQKSDEKYIICNADEGDPGAFMDRSTIEGDPHTSSRA